MVPLPSLCGELFLASSPEPAPLVEGGAGFDFQAPFSRENMSMGTPSDVYLKGAFCAVLQECVSQALLKLRM